MISSTRILNRALLLLAGLAALVGALLAARPLLPAALVTPWWQPALHLMDDAAEAVGSWRIALPGGSLNGTQIAVLGLGLLLVVALLAFLGTRRRRRARTVLRFADDAGSTAVDETIADAVLTDPLRRRADVLSTRTRAYRVAGATALRVSVVPRSGADLTALLTEAQSAVAEWDALSGARAPIVVHLADRGGFDRLRSSVRAR